MKSVLYRVETYIVPERGDISLQAAIDKIDDLKLANRLRIKDEDTCQSNTHVQNEKNIALISHIKDAESAKTGQLINIKIVKDITKQDDTLLDGQSDYHHDKDFCYRDGCVRKTELQRSLESQNTLYPVRHFKKVNSLMSIDERSESPSDSKLTDFCRHGYKNGCTAAIPPPEEISEEIFKDNWLQKLDALRQRETVLRERETRLQCKERELFRRERELRIMERNLKDKIKQMDEQLECQRNIQVVEKRLVEAVRILNHDFKEPETAIAQAEMPKESDPIVNVRCERNEESDKKIKRPMRSKSYSSRQSNATSGIHTYASLKYKEHPADRKTRYEDLNSTLSADPGDSSLVKTSALFNPEFYRKPYAFTRSASERWTKRTADAIVARPQGVIDAVEKPEHAIEEGKIFQKLSENICASQDKDTRFQDYGLVDYKPMDVQCKTEEHNSGNKDKIFSYLDLEVSNRCKPSSVAKSRPISWNEETSEWLQKKREAYNLAIKKSAENKENLKCNKVMAKSGKLSKKDTKNKLFILFR